MLNNSYINHAEREAKRLSNVHLTASDLERSDMGCLKKTLHTFMSSCHISDLVNNNFKFPDEDTAQNAVENSMPPDIPARSKIDQITTFIIKNVSKENDFG